LYAKAEPNGNGTISPNQAFNFLKKSKLPVEILSEIWKQTQRNNVLDREGFYKALKYIALAQNNQPINPQLLYKSTPPPVFEGIYINNTNTNTNSNQNINNLVISDNEYEKWSNLFFHSKPVRNNISGNTAKEIFLKSNLPTNVLAEVWQLVDLEKSGELDLNEFLIAMFIIMRLKDNTIREVPRAIPSNLWKSVAYNKNNPNLSTLSNSQQRYNSTASNDNSFVSSLTSPVSLNRTGGNTLPINVTGGNNIPLNITGGSIPVNMTGGSININKTGGSVNSVDKTGGSMITSVNRNNMLIPSNVGGYKTNTYDNSLKSFNSQSILSNHSSNQSLNSNYGNDYAITPQEQEKYNQLFNKLDIMGNQYITGEQSMDFFLKSGLSTPDLAQIWELADMNKVGRLTREEFYIAMHLIRQKKSGMTLPTTLPACLIPPSLRQSSMSNIGGNQPMSASFNNTSKVGSESLIGSFDSSPSKYTSSISNDTMGINSLRNNVNQLKSEIQQMDQNILSMTNDKQSAKNQRDQLEQELNDLNSKKNDLSIKIAQLKNSYDYENSKLNELRTTFAKENQNKEAAQADCNQLEEMVKNLKNERMFIEHDIERSKEEVKEFNNRIKELKIEYNNLKEEIDQLRAKQKHQNDLLNVTRQMAMTEQQNVDQLKQDKMNLQVSIMNGQKELEKATSERSVKDATKQDSKIINPFEQENESEFITKSPSKSSAIKNTFDDAFDQLSARATEMNSGRFETSFDDAFAVPNNNTTQNQENAFDDAFQIPGKKTLSPTHTNNVFDDAFQVSDAKEGDKSNTFDDDPFSKHAQSIPNAFDTNFNQAAAVEDPFNSSSNVATPSSNTFNDAFNVPNNNNNNNNNNNMNMNINSFDDAFKVNKDNNSNGFDDAFQNSNASNTQNAPQEFTADFNNAFEDPFKAADETSTTPNQAQPKDQAGFSFDHAINAAQEQAFSFENTPVSASGQDQAGFSFNNTPISAPGQDQSGFSFDNAFDNAAANATAPIPSSDPFKVSSPEGMNDQSNEKKDEENDSSIGEENDAEPFQQPELPEEEITNPFGDDQNIEDDEDYIDDDGEEEDNDNNNDDDSVGPEGVPEQPISMPMPMPVPVATAPEQVTSLEQQQELTQEEPISMPMQMPMPVNNTVPEPSQEQDQVIAGSVPPEQNIEEVPQEQTTQPQEQQQELQQEQEENVVESIPAPEQTQEVVPTPVTPEQTQPQPQPEVANQQESQASPEKQTLSENPFENKNDDFNNDNAFETDFNSAFQNMAISSNASNPNPENTENVQESEGNMIKSFSNNSIKINDLDIDKEFQDFVNNSSGFEKSETVEASAISQNNNNGNNISFDEEFEAGFDENDFNFDTTFDNRNTSVINIAGANADANANTNDNDNDNDNANANENANTNATNTNENPTGNPFGTFDEQSTAQFNTNFEAFNFDNFYNKDNEQKQSDAFMDEAFGVSSGTPVTGDSAKAFANFDNNFNDFNVDNNDPFAAFDNTNTSTANTPVTAANPTK